MGLALAALVVGIVGGLLLATQAPLWPTARRPMMGGWDGYWRRDATGGLEQFAANFECAELPGHRMQRATLVAPDALSCRYQPEGAGDVVLVELVHSPGHAVDLLRAAYPGRVSTAEERVALADGPAPGRRSTVRSTSAPTAGLDALVVRGQRITVEVSCLDFQGGVDVATCHATQAALFSSWKGGLAGVSSPP